MAGNSDVVPLASGGLEAWTEIRTVAKRAEEVTGTRFHVGVIYGRGNQSAEFVDQIQSGLGEQVELAHVLERDTLEEYLLDPAVLDRVITGQLIAAGRKVPGDFCPSSAEILDGMPAHSGTKDRPRIGAREVLGLFRQEVNERFAISFSDARIAECFRPEELPAELKNFLSRLDGFARGF